MIDNTEKCLWSTYGNRCSSIYLNSEGYCNEHSNENCCNCGMKATEGCDYCGQLVCGMPCCVKCGACSEGHGAKKERKIPSMHKIQDYKILNKKQLLVELEKHLKLKNEILIKEWKESLSEK